MTVYKLGVHMILDP